MQPNTVAAFAGSIPEKYDRYLGPFLFEPYALDIISRINKLKLQSVLEIACGTGRVTKHLRKALAASVRLVATDLNPDMLQVAKHVITDKNIEWQVADAQELPFADLSFDLILCQFGLMFVPDKSKALKEIYRILRPEGYLIFNTWDKIENNPVMHTGRKIIDDFFAGNPPLFYNTPFAMNEESEIRELVVEAGFKDIKITLVKKEGVSPSAGELATGIVEGNPILLEIEAKDRSQIEPIKKSVAKAIVTAHGDKPVKGILQAWICEARKR